MTAGDRYARRSAHAFAAFQYLADHFQRQFVDRHAHQGQRHDGCTAHRIYVTDRVGRGNPPEVVGVIDNRHEKIGGGDQRLLIVEPIHRCIIGGFDPDHEFLRHREVAGTAQDFGKQAGRNLAAAAAAVTEGSESNRRSGSLGKVHRFVLPCQFRKFALCGGACKKGKDTRLAQRCAGNGKGRNAAAALPGRPAKIRGGSKPLQDQ